MIENIFYFTMQVGKQLPKIQAITYGCPGVLSKDVADSTECRDLITSYIVDLDFASRLSYVHMAELRNDSIRKGYFFKFHSFFCFFTSNRFLRFARGSHDGRGAV